MAEPNENSISSNDGHRVLRSRSSVLLGGGISLLVLTLALSGGYVHYHNEVVALDMSTEAQWKQVENQLLRQYELIPMLSKVTRKFTEHEEKMLSQLYDARARYTDTSPQDRPAAAANLSGIAAEVLQIVERYPHLHSSEHYRNLSYEIAGTKNRVALERKRYNDLVAMFNARRLQVPWRLVAGGYPARQFFEPPAEKMKEPELDL